MNAAPAPADPHLAYKGFCPICEASAQFVASGQWYRGTLSCKSCTNGSVPRERALALVMNEQITNWRHLTICDCSPVNRGISAKLQRECANYIPTHYYPNASLGSVNNGFRNEDIGNMTFSDSSIDIFISLDVMEHIPDPGRAHQEIWRILKPGGVMLCTWPVRKEQLAAVDPRVEFLSDGKIKHLKQPEYHGNPIDNAGSLVTYDYGYELHKQIADWASFDVRIYRFSDKTHGILGEYTEVIFCRKRPF